MFSRPPSLVSALCSLTLLAAMAWPEVSGAAVVRQPYLQLGTPNSMIVAWRTDVGDPVDSVVEYGTVFGTYDQSKTGTSAIPPSNSGVRDNFVNVTGLTPGTKYFYRVGTGGSVVAGTVDHFFVASPAVGTGTPFSAWVIGDSGNNSNNQRDVRDAMLAFTAGDSPDLFLHVGDIAYPSGTDAQWTANHFAQY